jgi:hypothetical protein
MVFISSLLKIPYHVSGILAITIFMAFGHCRNAGILTFWQSGLAGILCGCVCRLEDDDHSISLDRDWGQ